MFEKTRNLIKNKEAIAFMAICLIVGIVMLIIGVIVMFLLIGMIKDFIMGGGCLLLFLPLAILIVVAILAKKHLFEGKSLGNLFGGKGD